MRIRKANNASNMMVTRSYANDDSGDEVMIITGVWGEYDAEEYECTCTFPVSYNEVMAFLKQGKVIYFEFPEATYNSKTFPNSIFVCTGNTVSTTSLAACNIAICTDIDSNHVYELTSLMDPDADLTHTQSFY